MRPSEGWRVLWSRCTVASAYSPRLTPYAAPGSPRRSATGPNRRAQSTITSPTTWTPSTTPSASRLRAATSVGQKSCAARWSVTTRLISSGMRRSNDRRPASTCATGIMSLAATSAAAIVELVSP